MHGYVLTTYGHEVCVETLGLLRFCTKYSLLDYIECLHSRGLLVDDGFSLAEIGENSLSMDDVDVKVLKFCNEPNFETQKV